MLSSLWVVFSLAFVVALSGALVPGPLLTYTVIRTMGTRRGAHLVGARVIAGHALLEGVLIAFLLAGFASVLRSPVTAKVIGAVGGSFLLFMGVRLVVDVARGKMRSPLEGPQPPAQSPDTRGSSVRGIRNPILGGILISMSNPYWWIWWATIGLAFMVQYDISFRNWPLLLAFIAGHEAGDLAWYWLVSAVVSVGRRGLSGRLYRVVLIACALVMVGFGVYLGISPYTASA